MLTYSNTNEQGVSRVAAAGNLILTAANGGGTCLWNATAMDLDSDTNAVNTIVQESQRTSTTCYMRGLSENLRIQTSSGLPWFHRRICFTAKDSLFRSLAPSDTNPQNADYSAIETSNGWQRLFVNMYVNNMPISRAVIEGIIFKGNFNQDWNDSLVAPLDTRRITVKFDKVWTIKSGNAVGTVVDRKLWHPMNKNIVYADDERGQVEFTSRDSVTSKAGMGNYLIYDIFTPGAAAAGDTSLMSVAAASTLYWHEK